MDVSNWYSEALNALISYKCYWSRSANKRYRKYQSSINPANGLPMVGSFDIYGNPYGVTDTTLNQAYQTTYDHRQSNDYFKSAEYHCSSTSHSYDYYNDQFRNY